MKSMNKMALSVNDTDLVNKIMDIMMSECSITAAVIDTDHNIIASSSDWKKKSENLHIKSGIDDALVFFASMDNSVQGDKKCYDMENHSLSCFLLNSVSGEKAVLCIIKNKEIYSKKIDLYHDIFESFEEGYFEIDLEGNLLYCNERMSEITGLSRDEVYGLNYKAYTSSSTSENLFSVYNEIFKTGKPSKISNFEFIKKDGSPGVFEISSGLLRDEHKKPIGFRGICRDASERIKSEKEKRMLADQLQQAQRFEAVATLAGGVAHDFNNLLMSIQGYLSLLQMGTDPDSKNYGYLKKIEEHIDKGASLTRQMLGVSFSETAFSAPCRIDINDLMKKIASDFFRNRTDLSLSLLMDTSECFAVCDASQIESVFSSILDNSVQAMPNGGSLVISTENVMCNESFVSAFNARPGKYILISVTDTGSGMDEKTRRRIFNPFFTTKDTGKASGLGLTSAFGIIKNHGGFITINSLPGTGTTVFVYIPASINSVS